MLRRVALVRTDVSEELSASFIRVTRISELGRTLAVTSSILVALMKEALSSSDTSVLTRATRRNIPEDAILHSHRRENLKSYIMFMLLCWNISWRNQLWIGMIKVPRTHYNKQTPWPLVREPTIPTDRPLVLIIKSKIFECQTIFSSWATGAFPEFFPVKLVS
jgi:hypothetical protein